MNAATRWAAIGKTPLPALLEPADAVAAGVAPPPPLVELLELPHAAAANNDSALTVAAAVRILVLDIESPCVMNPGMNEMCGQRPWPHKKRREEANYVMLGGS